MRTTVLVDYMKLLGLAVLFFSVLTGFFYWEKSLWDECRRDHSFWYCVRVLGK